MCGRYALRHSAAELSDWFGVPFQSNRAYGDNLFPGSSLPVLLRSRKSDKLEFHDLVWGLVPHWQPFDKAGANSPKGMINARRETVASKPYFRASFKDKRCVVPASCYYEWSAPPSNEQTDGQAASKKKVCWRISPVEGVFAFAGLWDVWRGGAGDLRLSFTIITRPAPLECSFVHSRAPVWLGRDECGKWLDLGGEDILQVDGAGDAACGIVVDKIERIGG